MSLLLLTFIRKLIKLLTSSNSPSQLALGFSIGAFIGLTPDNIFNTLVIITLLFILNVSFSSGLLSTGILSLFQPFVFPYAHSLGLSVLQSPDLKGTWTLLYNLPVIPFTHFNNTVMMGGILISITLFIPLYVLTKYLITTYHATLHTRLKNSKFVAVIKKSVVFEWIYKVWSRLS